MPLLAAGYGRSQLWGEAALLACLPWVVGSQGAVGQLVVVEARDAEGDSPRDVR